MKKIKAISVNEAGAPNILRVIELPELKPKDHEIVIEQPFAGINYGDVIRIKRGLFNLNKYGYFIPGFEGIGKIISVGKSVRDFTIGDRVGYLSEVGGGYSQQICLDEKFAFRVPFEIADETAATMTCVGTTAWNLTQLSDVNKNSWVIIHGATGGVGLLLVQLCLLRGAKAIAIVGTVEKKNFLKRYPLTEIIVRCGSDLSPQIKSVTDGQEIDVIFDCVGQAVLETNLNCIRKGGLILYYGSTSGHPSFPGMQVLMNSLRVQGFNIFNFLQDTENWRNGVQTLISLLIKKQIEIYIDRVLTMEQVHEAHQLLENRCSIGKLLLDLR